MNAHIRSLSDLAHVDAALNYLAPMTEWPRNYACEPPVGVPRSNTAPETYRVTEEHFDIIEG